MVNKLHFVMKRVNISVVHYWMSGEHLTFKKLALSVNVCLKWIPGQVQAQDLPAD